MGIVNWIRCKLDPEFARQLQHQMQQEEDERRRETIRRERENNDRIMRESANRAWELTFGSRDASFPGAYVPSSTHQRAIDGRWFIERQAQEWHEANLRRIEREPRMIMPMVSGVIDMAAQPNRNGDSFDEFHMRVQQIQLDPQRQRRSVDESHEEVQFRRHMAAIDQILQKMEERGRDTSEYRKRLEGVMNKWTTLREKTVKPKEKKRSNINFRV